MANGHANPKKSIYHHMVRGSAWGIAMRWCMKLIGFVSTIILVRLLTPFDFGIAAMGSLALGLVDSFVNFNVGMMLIRQVNATRDDYDTAWTMRLMQGILLAVLLLLTAPLAADFFESELARPVIQWYALTAALTGLANIGLVKARKELDFALEFRFGVYKRLLTFVATIVFAVWLRDYWALVFGPMLGAAFGVVLSYRMHPYRPRLSLAKWPSYFAFSAWLALRHFAGYFNFQMHLFLVGRAESPAFFGVYNIAAGLAKMATQEIGSPLARGLYPSFAKLVDRPAELARAYCHSLSALALLCIPIGIGLTCVAELFVPVVYGEKWVAAIPYVRWLAIYSVVNVIFVHLYRGIVIVLGKDRLATALAYVRLAVLAPTLILALDWYGVEAVPIAVAAVPAILMVPYAVVLGRILPFTLGDLFRSLWRPVVAASIMSLAVVPLEIPGLALFLLLLLKVAMGGLVYFGCVSILWWLSGRPEGPEGFTITRGIQLLKRLSGI